MRRFLRCGTWWASVGPVQGVSLPHWPGGSGVSAEAPQGGKAAAPPYPRQQPVRGVPNCIFFYTSDACAKLTRS